MRRNESPDPDLQEGIRRSLNDDYERPPPYNPDYNNDDDTVRPHANAAHGQTHQAVHSDDRIRNARLRRFAQQSS